MEAAFHEAKTAPIWKGIIIIIIIIIIITTTIISNNS